MKRVLFLPVILALAAQPAIGAESDAELLGRGMQLFSRGEYARAGKLFEQAVNANPGSAEANFRLGLCYENLGNDEVRTDPEVLGKAVQAFTRALAINPDFAQARYHLGITYLALYEKEAALREYGVLKSLDGELARGLSTRIEGYKAPAAYRQLGSRGDAGSSLTKVVIVGNTVLVPVTLGNGDRTVEATLVLDTGASITTVTREIASRLNVNLEQSEKTVGMVAGGALIRAWQTRLNYVTVGPHTKNDMTVDIIDHKGPQVPYDGLLGMDFLRNFRYHIDFKNRVIEWTQ